MLFHDLSVSILLCRAPCDMRKSIDGLSLLISSEFHYEPTDGRIYVFMNKSRDKIKLLYWDKNGFCLWYKRVEKEKFIMPKIDGETLVLTPSQFQWLLSGLNIEKVKGFKALKYKHFY